MAKRSDSWDLNEDDQRHQELSLEWGRLHQGLKIWGQKSLQIFVTWVLMDGKVWVHGLRELTAESAKEGGDRTSEWPDGHFPTGTAAEVVFVF